MRLWIRRPGGGEQPLQQDHELLRLRGEQLTLALEPSNTDLHTGVAHGDGADAILCKVGGAEGRAETDHVCLTQQGQNGGAVADVKLPADLTQVDAADLQVVGQVGEIVVGQADKRGCEGRHSDTRYPFQASETPDSCS